MGILAPLTDSQAGSLAWAATRVRISKTGRRIDLPRFEGTVPVYQLPGAELVPTVKS